MIRGGMQMERMDKNREGQIWQRVMNPQPVPSRDGLRGLRRESAALAGMYRQLMTSLNGKTGELAGQLYREEMDISNCLRGLEVLRGEDGGKLKLPQQPREPAVRLLRSCHEKTRNCMTEYMARTVDGETGAVFRRLADRAEQQCMRIAELAGML